MPKYPNAIGYIRELGHLEGIPWFEMICDLSSSGKKTLSPSHLEILIQLFTGNASYLRRISAPLTNATNGITSTTIDRLERVGPFNGFKRLCNTLVAFFPKRVIIIFGANGSGKSSICEALKILASSDVLRRPLHDLHSGTTSTPSFKYKFTSDVSDQTWSSPADFGLKADIIKYFDSGIAIHNIKNTVEPGRIIELSPFKLDIFENAINLCEELRIELQKIQKENMDLLHRVVDQIRTVFASYDGMILSNLNMPIEATFDTEIILGESYSKTNGLDEKLERKAEYEKATSDVGQALLKAEVAAFRALHEEVQPILNSAEKLIEIDPFPLSQTLKKKEYELETLAESLIPTGATLNKLMTIIRSANEVCNLIEPDTAECPLCKQTLRESELILFKQYAALLTGEIDLAINELKKTLKSAEYSFNVIAESSPENWAQDSILAPTVVDDFKRLGKEIKNHLKEGCEINLECRNVALSLREINDKLQKSLEEKAELVKESGDSREQLIRELDAIAAECQKLQYAKEISENIDLVKEAHYRYQNAGFWNSKLPVFTGVLRKITSTAKKAHKELVVEDFERRLNDEYIKLAEKDMKAFGVEIKDVGGEGIVTVDHHVAGERIEIVLSEGEQRIHSLALFFAELESCGQQVVIFDDPVSSFDYNYIANYCKRLRDLIQNHSNRQIIVFTHNWEFFVQIQMTLNAARLSNEMSVQVLESCSTIDEYNENVVNLKTDIDAILSISGELVKSQKEVVAGKLRRLIEAIVNTHVFNKQRHQFKQKSQQISAFDDFTKIVPLLSTEAQELKDLFARLSITEHDDPRNAYVNTDKAMFQTRYEIIKNIESAIMGRK